MTFTFVSAIARPSFGRSRSVSCPSLGCGPLGWNYSLSTRTPARRIIASANQKRIPYVVRPVVPSKTLCEFVEDKAQFRATILKSLSAYVKSHNLQDEDDRRLIHCDERLKNLFGVSQCTILQMSKFVSPHLQKPEDIGGRYLSEAQDLERRYLEEKLLKDQKKKETGSSRRSRVASGPSKENRKAGTKLFKPVVLSEELSAICRSQKELPRQEIVKAVWEYIRLNNLQGKRGEPIKCDFLLKRVYNADYIDVKTVMKGIGAHVRKKE